MEWCWKLGYRIYSSSLLLSVQDIVQNVKKNKKNKPLITPLGYEVQFCKKLDPNMKKIKKLKNKILKRQGGRDY